MGDKWAQQANFLISSWTPRPRAPRVHVMKRWTMKLLKRGGLTVLCRGGEKVGLLWERISVCGEAQSFEAFWGLYVLQGCSFVIELDEVDFFLLQKFPLFFRNVISFVFTKFHLYSRAIYNYFGGWYLHCSNVGLRAYLELTYKLNAKHLFHLFEKQQPIVYR